MKSHLKALLFKFNRMITEMISLSFTRNYNKIKTFTDLNQIAGMKLIKAKAWQNLISSLLMLDFL